MIFRQEVPNWNDERKYEVRNPLFLGFLYRKFLFYTIKIRDAGRMART